MSKSAIVVVCRHAQNRKLKELSLVFCSAGYKDESCSK